MTSSNHQKLKPGRLYRLLPLLLTLAGTPWAQSLEISTSDGDVMVVAESTVRGWNSHSGRNLPASQIATFAEFPAHNLRTEEARELASLRAPEPYYRREAREAIAESVIPGEDVRHRIYPNESGFPERAIGQITFQQGFFSYICTGWLINRNTVATAAHCLHGGPGGDFSENVQFFPGRNGNSNPYGSCSARSLFVPAAWRTSGDEKHDYGAFKLNCNVGNATGFFGLMNLSTINGISVAITGYPGDKPAGTSWSGSGDVVSSDATKVRYRIDTAGGQSGSPIFEPDRVGAQCTGVCALGIHAYGVSGGTNSGTRINSAVLALLNTARNAP